jgi:hypothetical protein
MPWTGSLTSLSLSLMMRLGNPDILEGDDQRLLGQQELVDVWVYRVQVVLVSSSLFAGVFSDVMMLAPIQV